MCSLDLDEMYLTVLRMSSPVKRTSNRRELYLKIFHWIFLSMISVSLGDKCPLVPALQGENKTRKERRAEEGEKSDPRNANSPTCTPVSKLHIQQNVLT